MTHTVGGAQIRRGAQALQDLIDAAPDLRMLDRAAFGPWIAARFEEAKGDEVFRQRCKARDLRRENRRKIGYRRRRISQARAAYSSCGCGPDLERLQRDVAGAEAGVEGLQRAVDEGRADPSKLAAFEARLASLRLAQEAKLAECPERTRLDATKTSLRRFEEDLGLATITDTIQEMNKSRGRSGSSRGRRFEEISAEILRAVVVPELAGDGPTPVCLSGATLGCARGEFDHLIVVRTSVAEPVDVLAMVEAKRNINDLAHGFRLRQENLAWLTGASSGFDPAMYRTKHFPSGQFDRVVEHEEAGETYRFDRSSFRRFTADPDTGDFLVGLWFVTEARRVTGLSSEQRQRLVSKLATDPSVDPQRPASLARTRPWVARLLEGDATRDVLLRYVRAGLADQILIRERV